MASKEHESDSLQKIIGNFEDQEHEHYLLQITKRKPNKVFEFAASYEASRDPLMKGYYLQQMMDSIKQNKRIKSYLDGIYYTHKIGRVDLNRILSSEMIKKHPIVGRFYKIIDNDWFD